MRPLVGLLPLHLQLLLACVAGELTTVGNAQRGELRGTLAAAPSPARRASQQARLCLSRVSPLPKAEGYGALCTSIEALYVQQETSTSSILELQEEGKRAREANAELEKRNQELQAKLEDQHLHNVKREKEWQAAAKKFQADVASRDAQWKATVSRAEVEAAKTLRESLDRAQAAAVQRLQKKLAARDSHWREIVRRVGSERNALEHRVAQQKEAAKASTSVDTRKRRAILLALSREKQRCRAENQEAQELLAQVQALQRENALAVTQIKALQKENAHLVQRYA